MHFAEATRSAEIPATTKPFELGLFTSTGTLGTYGMWLCLLVLNRGSTLFPFPWNVWMLQASPDARVFEITTATEWVEFVLEHAMHRDGLLYPDWKLVASRWDAVHMTVRAIAAVQGARFAVNEKVVAPPYWDVESTLWLRWAFTATEPIQDFMPDG
jgi:hypothetical protein